jgi:muramidase (phage lysozyme)
MRWILAVAATVALAVILAKRNASTFADGSSEVEQGASLWDDVVTNIDPATYAQPDLTQAVADGNVAAGLATLRYAEGTSGDNGYRTLFGGGLFDSFDDHPRIARQFTDQAGKKWWTSAAGAYQIMAVSPLPIGGSTKVDTWDRVRSKLQLVDFSPASQDLAAIELIRQRGALGDLMAGNVAEFVRKCAPEWASLPGAGYAQPERALSDLVAVYVGAGGITSEA